MPNDFEDFKEHCKTPGAERDPGLRAMLAAIATARHPAYAALADFVAQLMDLTRPLPWP